MDVPRESLKALLGELLAAGYVCRTFDESPLGRDLFLRHDIDFSIDAAVETAELESEMGVKATYFFMLSSHFYNVLARASQEKIRRVQALGHVASLHFDPTVYENIDSGFELERDLFEGLFGDKLKIVSLHRPQGFLDDNNRALPGVRHTYEDRFFRQMHYVSDSKGGFRHGHPLESAAFREGNPIHLLLHPIWWVTQGSTPSEKLRGWQRNQHDFLLGEMSRNCLAFDGRSSFVSEGP